MKVEKANTGSGYFAYCTAKNEGHLKCVDHSLGQQHGILFTQQHLLSTKIQPV